MDMQLIARTMEKRGLSKTGLAKALGIVPSAVTALLKGDRRLRADEVPKAREYVGLDSVPLKGYVGAGDAVAFYDLPDNEIDKVPAPEDVTENTVALEIRGDSLGAALNGWLVYYDNVRRPITRALYGKLCVVGLADGRILIKKVRQSKQKGLFHLIPSFGEAIMDVPIEWADLVKQMQSR